LGAGEVQVEGRVDQLVGIDEKGVERGDGAVWRVRSPHKRSSKRRRKMKRYLKEDFARFYKFISLLSPLGQVFARGLFHRLQFLANSESSVCELSRYLLKKKIIF